MTYELDSLKPVAMKGSKGNPKKVRYYSGSRLVAKYCKACDTIHDIEAFYPDRSRADGYRYECSEDTRRAVETYVSNRTATEPTYLRDASRRFRAANPGYSKEHSARQMHTRAARNAAEISRDRKRLRPSGRKACNRCDTAFPLEEFYANSCNPDGLSTLCTDCDDDRRRMKLRKHWTAAGVPFDQCIYCQMMTDLTPGDLHGDHVFPRSLGGPDEMYNIAPACYSCNICKGETPVSKFLAEQFHYDDERQEALDRLRMYGYITT